MGKTKKRRRNLSPTSSSASISSSSASSSENEAARAMRQVQKLKKQLKRLEAQKPTTPSFLEETLLPEFDPSHGALTSIEWLKKVESVADTREWEDSVAVRMAVSRLRGNARIWYDTLTLPKRLLWSEFAVLIKNNFPAPVRFGRILIEAANYAPKPGQNLGDYCFEKVSLLNKLNLQIPDEYLIDSVIESIPDESVKVSTRAANCTTIGTLANFLGHLSLSAVVPNSSNSQNWKSATMNQSGRWKNKHLHKVKNSARQLTPEKREPGTILKSSVDGGISCYNCGGQHIVKNCDKPIVKCLFCRKFGHQQDTCRKKAGSKKEVNTVDSSTLNLYKKVAVINGSSVDCLVDTGSTSTLMRHSVALRLRLEIKKDLLGFALKCFIGHNVFTELFAETQIRVDEVVAVVKVLTDLMYLVYRLV